MAMSYIERKSYHMNECLADIGGSLGLILGLSLVDILLFGKRIRLYCKTKRHLAILANIGNSFKQK